MLLIISNLIVYSIFAITLYICAKQGIQTNWKPTRWYSMPSAFKWCLLIFSIISGVRYDVGIDYLQYLEFYKTALEGHNFVRERGIEEGYIFVTRVFAYIGLHPVLYFGFLAFLQLIFILWAFRNERGIVPYILILIILGGYFFTWMNGIRQMIAACVFVYSISFIRDRKFIPFLFCVLFSYIWHHSAVLLFPFYLLAYDKRIWKNTYINIIIFIFCFIWGNTPFGINDYSIASELLSFMDYENYSERVDSIFNPDNFRTFNIGPRFITQFFTYIIVIISYPKIRNQFNNTKIDIVFKLFFIGICLYYLLVNTGHLFLRPVLYCTIFALPMTAYVLVGLLKSNKQFLYYILLICSLSFTYISCISDASLPVNERHCYLYYFYFMNAF